MSTLRSEESLLGDSPPTLLSDVPTGWIDASAALPPVRTEVVAWLVGFQVHHEMTWHREGKAFLVRWDNAPKETAVDGWSERHLEAARQKLDAVSLRVTHWMLANKPEGLS